MNQQRLHDISSRAEELHSRLEQFRQDPVFAHYFIQKVENTSSGIHPLNNDPVTG
jgi:hypothetical protein